MSDAKESKQEKKADEEKEEEADDEDDEESSDDDEKRSEASSDDEPVIYTCADCHSHTLDESEMIYVGCSVMHCENSWLCHSCAAEGGNTCQFVGEDNEWYCPRHRRHHLRECGECNRETCRNHSSECGKPGCKIRVCEHCQEWRREKGQWMCVDHRH